MQRRPRWDPGFRRAPGLRMELAFPSGLGLQTGQGFRTSAGASTEAEAAGVFLAAMRMGPWCMMGEGAALWRRAYFDPGMALF